MYRNVDNTVINISVHGTYITSSKNLKRQISICESEKKNKKNSFQKYITFDPNCVVSEIKQCCYGITFNSSDWVLKLMFTQHMISE